MNHLPNPPSNLVFIPAVSPLRNHLLNHRNNPQRNHLLNRLVCHLINLVFSHPLSHLNSHLASHLFSRRNNQVSNRLNNHRYNHSNIRPGSHQDNLSLLQQSNLRELQLLSRLHFLAPIHLSNQPHSQVCSPHLNLPFNLQRSRLLSPVQSPQCSHHCSR